MDSDFNNIFGSNQKPEPQAQQPAGGAAPNPAQILSSEPTPSMVDPTNPAPQQPVVVAATDPNSGKKVYLVFTIVFGVLAGIGIIAAVVLLLMYLKSSENAASLEQNLSTKNAIIKVIEKQTGATINSAEDVPTFATTTDNIYLGSWGVKIKLIDTLKDVSYIMDANYRPSICFNAVGSGVEYFPEFADIDKNPGGMGCLVKVAVSEGNSDKSGVSFGDKVITVNDYNYFYKAPAGIYSKTDAEKGLEATAVEQIKAMLTGNVSAYK